MASVVIKNATIRYPIYSGRSKSLKNQLVRLSTGGLIEHAGGEVTHVTAINNLTFAAQNGDCVGLWGHNGSGKSTLLRTIAGIFPLYSGSIEIEGSVSTIFEIGAGMDMELSGYENILRMNLLLGRTLKDSKDNIQEIEEFSELGEFLNLPVKSYSSGMTMRLMYGVATSVRPEILLIDEMFFTGDNDFQNKALKRTRDLVDSTKIMFMASHSKELLLEFCNKILVMEHANIVNVLSTDEFKHA